jgi:putative oxygen-independent coproporphyrinogen III oxidase
VSARHVYLHLPFCAHRCGYCDFVTVVGRQSSHDAYVAALLRELDLRRPLLADRVETVFLGGGTPTFTDAGALSRLLDALPEADEVTVEANPETVTPGLAALLMSHGATRVSLGMQSFVPSLLSVLERRASPDHARRAVHALREAGFTNVSLDLLYGIPGQSLGDLDADIAAALELAPEHVSYYELEAKPGTRFTHRWGVELGRQREAMEGYFEHVVEQLTGAGFRWYETANFARADAGDRDLRAHHNLGYWLGHDYIGVGIGAVSTVGGVRWKNGAKLSGYVAALSRGELPPSEPEELSESVRLRERVMLGLRLDEPLALADVAPAIDARAMARLERLCLVARSGGELRLTDHGRRLGAGVTAELLAYTDS